MDPRAPSAQEMTSGNTFLGSRNMDVVKGRRGGGAGAGAGAEVGAGVRAGAGAGVERPVRKRMYSWSRPCRQLPRSGREQSRTTIAGQVGGAGAGFGKPQNKDNLYSNNSGAIVNQI